MAQCQSNNLVLGFRRNSVFGGVNVAKSWTVDEVIRVRADGGGWRVWRVIAVCLGGTHQEDVIELETLDRDRNTQGRILVPRELLNASIGTVVDG